MQLIDIIHSAPRPKLFLFSGVFLRNALSRHKPQSIDSARCGNESFSFLVLAAASVPRRERLILRADRPNLDQLTIYSTTHLRSVLLR